MPTPKKLCSGCGKAYSSSLPNFWFNKNVCRNCYSKDKHIPNDDKTSTAAPSRSRTTRSKKSSQTAQSGGRNQSHSYQQKDSTLGVTGSLIASKFQMDISVVRRVLSGMGASIHNGSDIVSDGIYKQFKEWHDRYVSKLIPDAPSPPAQQGKRIIQERLPQSKLDYVWPREAKVSPFSHQLETTEFLATNSRAFCLNDMGTGKTLSVLWAFDYARRQRLVQKMLVVCPLSTMQSTWAEEIERNFAGILRYKILHGDAVIRHRKLREDAEIYIINPDGLTRLPTLIDELGRRPEIDLIVIDEIAQAARNAGTNRFKALLTICNRQHPRLVWGLTGTPIPNSPTDAWAQCRLLVPDKVPPYFNRFKDMVVKQINQFLWVPRANALDIVHEAMQPSIRFDRDACIDLPPCVYETRQVELSEKQIGLYREMLHRLHTEFDGKEIDAPNEMVKTLKLLQIAAGAPYTIQGDAVFPPMPDRLDVVGEIIDESSGKVIVFVPFRGAIQAVVEYIEKKFRDEGTMDIVAVVHGGISSTNRSVIFSQFQSSANPRVLVAQAQAMSHGLTLTAANTIVWFGPTTSADTYTQANARITRPGQVNCQFIVHIEGCEIERRIFQRVREKQKIQGVLLDMLAEQFGTKAVPKGSMPQGYEVIQIDAPTQEDEAKSMASAESVRSIHSEKDFWFKVVGMLQQNWAIIETESGKSACTVVFFTDTSEIFDRLSFDSVEDANAGLLNNGFQLFEGAVDAQSFIAAPSLPLHEGRHPSGAIYSSGKYWIR